MKRFPISSPFFSVKISLNFLRIYKMIITLPFLKTKLAQALALLAFGVGTFYAAFSPEIPVSTVQPQTVTAHRVDILEEDIAELRNDIVNVREDIAEVRDLVNEIHFYVMDQRPHDTLHEEFVDVIDIVRRQMEEQNLQMDDMLLHILFLHIGFAQLELSRLSILHSDIRQIREYLETATQSIEQFHHELITTEHQILENMIQIAREMVLIENSISELYNEG
ncbi:MAG: hypothetical protein CBD40_03975 [Gammaproteobacteria bacterium TMED180]|nr:MAG: hypothetical protein CBD40_03975 [Gammaproteobacteria bacterium TMED180]